MTPNTFKRSSEIVPRATPRRRRVSSQSVDGHGFLGLSAERRHDPTGKTQRRGNSWPRSALASDNAVRAVTAVGFRNPHPFFCATPPRRHRDESTAGSTRAAASVRPSPAGTVPLDACCSANVGNSTGDVLGGLEGCLGLLT